MYEVYELANMVASYENYLGFIIAEGGFLSLAIKICIIEVYLLKCDFEINLIYK